MSDKIKVFILSTEEGKIAFTDYSAIIQWIEADLESSEINDDHEYKIEVKEMTKEEFEKKLPEWDGY